MNIEIIDPCKYPDWNDLLLTNKNCSFFHTSNWAKVLKESYNYKPCYFTWIKNGKLSALFPIMDVRSFLTGRRGVSLPFTDYCQPIASDNDCFQEIFNEVIKYGKKARWKYIEWRDFNGIPQDATPSVSYYGHTLDLVSDKQKVFSSFRSSTKRNIKKAVKEGIDVELCHSLESVREFYRLNCITRKYHGLPPQPYLFFKKVHEHIISMKKGFVALAYHSKNVIAGAVYFHFGEKAIYKYGASDRDYQRLRPNNLVMWEAIKSCVHNGFKTFDFGRTEPENKGLMQFKRGWHANERIIKYYRYDLTKNTFVKGGSTSRASKEIFKMLPSPLLNLAGSLLYRHVA